MKKLLTLLAGAFCAVLLSTSTMAATEENPSLFNAGEVGLSIGSGYTVDRAAAFQQEYKLNFNAGVFYFPFRYLGVEANVPFYNEDSVAVQEVQAGLLFRLPLAKSTPILRNLAPYVGIGGVYNWQTEQDWAYIGKVGLDVRLNKKWGVFVEGQYRNSDFEWNDGQTSLNGGLKLVF